MMSENRKILTPEREKGEIAEQIRRPEEGRDLAEVKEAQQSVSEGLTVLNENAEVLVNGEVTEDEKKGKAVYNGGSAANVTKPTSKATSTSAPTIEVMIKETVTAIQDELKVREGEVKSLSKKNAQAYEINEAAKRIRFLNGLLYQLNRAAKLAEEFVVGLWKQFVRKA